MVQQQRYRGQPQQARKAQPQGHRRPSGQQLQYQQRRATSGRVQPQQQPQQRQKSDFDGARCGHACLDTARGHTATLLELVCTRHGLRAPAAGTAPHSSTCAALSKGPTRADEASMSSASSFASQRGARSHGVGTDPGAETETDSEWDRYTQDSEDDDEEDDERAPRGGSRVRTPRMPGQHSGRARERLLWGVLPRAGGC